MDSATQQGTQPPDAGDQSEMVSARRGLADGDLVTFVMPEAAGSKLRLAMDGFDTPVTVKALPRACMGDTVNGGVYEGRMHVLKVAFGVMGAVVGPQ